ncbi:MAG: hypothetical protein ABL920_09735 [Methylotenera sp.]
MKNSVNYFILIVLSTVLLACSEGKSEHGASPQAEVSEAKPTKTAAAKFFDENNCSQYENIYEALPHFDVYQNIDFYTLDCQSIELESPYSTELTAKYADKKSRNNFSAVIYEVKGKSAAQELNMIAMAKASYQMA